MMDKEDQIVAPLLSPQLQQDDDDDDDSSSSNSNNSSNLVLTRKPKNETSSSSSVDGAESGGTINLNGGNGGNINISPPQPHQNNKHTFYGIIGNHHEEEEEEEENPSSPLVRNGISIILPKQHDHGHDDDDYQKKEENVEESAESKNTTSTNTSNGDDIVKSSSPNTPLVFYDNRQGAVPANGTVNAHTEKNGTLTFKSTQEIQTAEIDLIHENDNIHQVDLDVENVLQNQTTHDLFCPNCKSCITTRVILRKRKRSPRLSAGEPDGKRTVLAPESDSIIQTEGDTTQLLLPDDEPNTEPDVFRCLSCFSFFIPSGNGFKLFRKFGDKRDKQSNVGHEQVPNVRKNWFNFMFQPKNKEDTAVGEGDNSVTMRQDRDVANPFSSSNIDAKVGQSETYTGEKLNESKSTEQVQVNCENDPTETTHSHGGLMFVSSDNGHATSEKDNEAVQRLPTSFAAFPGEKQNISVASSHGDHQGGTYIVTESVVENDIATFATSEPGEVRPCEVSQHTTTKSTYEVHVGETMTVNNIPSISEFSVAQGKDTVITFGTQRAESSQILQGPISPESALHSGTPITIVNPDRSVDGKKFEVIKSIVYGGLAESITSLSVVSSAAGGGAATLNILAIGMANLIGGLFVICHNLWELRCDHIEQVTNQITDELTNEKDRYRKLLGRRENFILHSVVAIISYLIFGLLPPAVYGFSFRKSDDKEFKLLAVAAASLLSILILALGKAYVQRPPKHYIKCVFTFVMLGFMVSGVSYAAGILVERLLEKFHLFEPSPVTNLLVPRMTGASSAWSSH